MLNPTSMLRIPIVIVLLATFVIYGCFKEPELVGIDNIEILSLADSLVEANVICYVNNPNILGATIKKITGDVMVNGKRIGFVDEKRAVKIGKGKTEKVQLHSFINIEQLSKLFPDLLSDKMSTLEVNGRAEIDGGVTSFVKDLKIKKSMHMKPIVEDIIAKQLSENTIKIKKVVPKKLGIQDSKMEISLEFSNPLKVDFNIHEVKADIYLDGEDKSVAQWANDSLITVKAESNALIVGIATIGNSNVFTQGGSMVSFFFNRKVNVRGNAVISLLNQKFKIPFKQTVEVNYNGF